MGIAMYSVATALNVQTGSPILARGSRSIFAFLSKYSQHMKCHFCDTVLLVKGSSNNIIESNCLAVNVIS